jgi:excisionase family DNA binding protein
MPDSHGFWERLRRICGQPARLPDCAVTLAAMAADRFLTPADVAEVLNISMSQTMALLRSGDLEGIKIGGRGQWRVGRDKLEAYIGRMYDQTREFVAAHPFTDAAEAEANGATGSADGAAPRG